MLFDEHNAIVKLCALGMAREGEGNADEASALFQRAWEEAQTDLEKCAAAHYLARHQQSIADKLIWDRRALAHAMHVRDEQIKGSYPSLYLNIGKCLEDLDERSSALEQYQLAFSYVSYLGDDGYGRMIKAGILKGMERTGGRQGRSRRQRILIRQRLIVNSSRHISIMRSSGNKMM